MFQCPTIFILVCLLDVENLINILFISCFQNDVFVAEAGARTGPGAAATIIGRPGARAVKRGTALHGNL